LLGIDWYHYFKKKLKESKKTHTSSSGMVLYQTGLLVPGRPMGTFPSDALLQHQKYIGATLKNMRETKSFDSRIRKLQPQHEHHVFLCNIHHEICGNNSCNIEDQLLKHMLERPIFLLRPNACALAFRFTKSPWIKDTTSNLSISSTGKCS